MIQNIDVIKKFINKSNEAYVIIDEQLNIIFINDSCKKYYFNNNNKQISDLLCLVDYSGFDEFINKCIANPANELSSCAKYLFSNTIVNVFLSHIEAGYFALKIIDIISVNESISNEESPINSIIDSISDLVFFKDDIGNYIYVNKSFEDYFGIDKIDVIGKNDEVVFGSNLLSGGFNIDNDDYENLYDIKEEIFVDKEGISNLFEIKLKRHNNSVLKTSGLIFVARNIEYKKEIEKQLIESRDFYLTLFEEFPALIWRAGVDGKCDYFNKNWLAFTGRTFAQEYGDGWAEGVHPDDLDFCFKNYIEHFNRKAPFRMEYRLMRYDGIYRWILDIGTPFYYKSGDFGGYIGSCYDITDEKELNNKIDSGRKQFDDVLKAGDTVFFTCDTNLILTDYYGSIRNAETNNPISLIGEHVKQIYDFRFDFTYLNFFKSVITGEPMEFDSTYYYEKEIGHYHNALAPIIDKTGVIVGLTGIITNVSKIKNTVSDLQETQAKYKLLVDNAFDAIYVMSGRVYEYVNPMFSTLTGYSLDELISGSFDFENLLTDDAKVLINERYKARERGELISNVYEIPIKRKTGEIREVEISTVSLGQKGKVFVLGFMRDITDKKRYLRQLQVAKDNAENLNKIKNSFIANISHELRTPLNGILGFTDLLCEEILDVEHKEMLSYINESGQRLKDTLNKILDLSRLEANTQEIVRVELNLASALAQTIETYKTIAKNKDLDFIVTMDEAVLVFLDEYMLVNIVNNLVENAIKFTNSGKIEIEVSKTIIQDSEFAKIRISDTGIGFTEEQIKIIFEEFRQGSEGIARNFEGLGLGLTISKKYVELLGGKLSVRSSAKQGSDFTVLFPIFKSNEAIENTKINARQRLLLVEDDPVNQLMVKKIVIKYFDLDIAKNSGEAFEFLQKNNYNLILMDINLGKGLTGKDIIKEIKASSSFSEIPIIVVTAFAMQSDHDEFINDGADGYLAKPFSKKELLTSIKKFIDIEYAG